MVAKLMLCSSILTLTTLVLLRFFNPDLVVFQPLGYVLNFSWSLLLFLGLAQLKGIINSSVSPGGAIAVISALLTTCITDYLFGLGWLAKAKSDPVLIVFFTIVALLMLVSWYKVFFKN
ncbi:hypothetical protein FE810_13775 [Thalassotalea litorea]|uniref:Uncharacterized protein n=1 Tax=Thalassotalea litorea TaxID=2020715 RepID=A0A5R9IGV5_9GAMM|nr:hypothetical protein [Thalassotalea litorea]TLU61880.1 hypothetical protein FE810_13775 [Thalassotalea litorea]